MRRAGPTPFPPGAGAKAEAMFYAAGEVTQTVSEKEKEAHTRERGGRKRESYGRERAKTLEKKEELRTREREEGEMGSEAWV